MKTALILLLLLGIASVLAVLCGELLPTSGLADPDAYYRDRLASPTYQLVHFFGLLRPYSSFWYLGLLGALALSLSACVSTRLRRLVRMSVRIELLIDPSELAGLRHHQSWTAIQPYSAREVASLLRARGYRVATEDPEGDRFQVAGSRHGPGRLGALLSHIGLLSIFIGGILLAGFSTSQFVWISEGEKHWVPEGGYSVLVDSFEVVLDENEDVADYLTYASILEDDRTVAHHTIEVNHPLRRAGYSWYQSSYRLRDDRVRSVSVRVHGDRQQTLRLMPGVPTPIPGIDDITLRLQAFVPHYLEREGRVMSASEELVDPAVNIWVMRPPAPPISTWVRLAAPNDGRGGPVPVPYSLSRVDPSWDTGLEIRNFPGAAWIWTGFGLMSLGLFLSFLLDHRRIWIFGTATDRGVLFLAGGDAMHAGPSYGREIRKIATDLGMNDYQESMR